MPSRISERMDLESALSADGRANLNICGFGRNQGHRGGRRIGKRKFVLLLVKQPGCAVDEVSRFEVNPKADKVGLQGAVEVRSFFI